jgi:hypothetical protein
VCYYITGVLAAGGDAVQVRRIAEGFHIRWEPIETPSIKKQLAAGESYYYTTWSTCDCGTTLGSDRTDPGRPRNHDRKVAQLQKQGWSAAKIERWLADREAVATRKERAKAEQGAVPGADAEQWAEFLRTVLTRKAAISIGLLLHWYKRGVENERFSVLECQSLAKYDLTAEFLARIDEDVFYRFNNAARDA